MAPLHRFLALLPALLLAVYAMIQVLEKCFAEKVQNEWKEKLKEIIPSYGQKLSENPALTEAVRHYTKEKLELEY